MYTFEDLKQDVAAEAQPMHTPGPWQFGFGKTPETVPVESVKPENDSVEGKGWSFKAITVCNSNKEILAEVKAYTTSGFLQDFKQWEANARLIAAAPDMYEIIKELYDFSIASGMKGPIFPKLEAVLQKIEPATSPTTT